MQENLHYSHIYYNKTPSAQKLGYFVLRGAFFSTVSTKTRVFCSDKTSTFHQNPGIAINAAGRRRRNPTTRSSKMNFQMNLNHLA